MKEKILNNKLFVLSILIVLVSFTIGKISLIASNILITIMLLVYFFLVTKDATKNILRICAYLIAAPLVSFGFIGLLTLEVLNEINKQLVKDFVDIEYQILFVFILAISSCFILFSKNEEYFLDKAKVATRVNNAIFLIITSTAIYYAYSTNDFSHIFQESTLESFKEFNLDERSAFITGINFIFFPYLISNAILMALVEYLQYKEKINK